MLSILLVILVIALAAGGFFNTPAGPPPPERCEQCGARIEFSYRGGKYCESCTKTFQALQEAVERAKFLEQQKR
ncbi:MAG: hypothetical protein NTW87_06345 [Planctomycetota bacterium]|nr:hypothetical protein [Planctomycetota bacterium]